MPIPPRITRPFAALLLAFVLAPPAAAQAGPDLFREGLDLYRAGDYAGAQRSLREYVEAYGERTGAQAEHLGEAYHYLGLMTPDARLAEGYFLAVAQRYPSAPIADESVARLAQLYAVRGEHEEARQQWQTLARSYPLSRFVPEVDLRVGESWLAQGELESAYDAFSRGFSRMKEYQRSGGQGANLRELEGEYVYQLGRTLLARGAAGEARKYLNLVLLDYPGHPLEPLALYHLTESYRAEGDTREAEEAWRRFGESVRNTSLESVSENPNLVAVARARESGDLEPRPTESEADAPGAEAMDAELEDARAAAAAAAEAQDAEPRDAPSPDEDEALTRAAGEADDLAPPSDEQGLRAPEPGRAGGVVEDEPLGRSVETSEADAAQGAEDQAVEADAEAEADAMTAAQRDSAARAAVDAARREEDRPDAAEPADSEVTERSALEAAEREAADREAAAAAAEQEAAAAAEDADRETAAAAERAEREAAEGQAAEAAEREAADVVTDADETVARESQVREQGRAVAAGQAQPPEAAAPPGLEPIPPGVVFLQMGAFTSAQSAGRLSSELRRKGFEPLLHSGLLNGQGYYRVRLGPYEMPSDRSILESMRTALGNAGFEAVVMRSE